ncbi:MAG: TlpA family protein disulfide reductase [Actinobacteria bacterium]|nr:TlpA family protein disulfide reductase [Actinomycetota bacterium]
MRMRLNLLIGLGLLVALVAAVAAVSADKDSKRADAPELSSTEQGSGEVGGKVAAFTAKDIDARTVRVGRGKPGALFFFAGWCGSCLSEAKALDQVQRALGSRVTITAISPDPSDSPEAIRRFRQQVGNPSYSFVSGRTHQRLGACPPRLRRRTRPKRCL